MVKFEKFTLIKPEVVEAFRWMKHEDHPAVVRAGGFTNSWKCDCGKPCADHGWVDIVDDTICPGQWLVLRKSSGGQVLSHQRLSQREFKALYKPVSKPLPKPKKGTKK